MGSRDRLWAIYGEAWGWPPPDMTAEQDREDLQHHWDEIQTHESFNYALFDADETELIGCCYIDPTDKAGADADISWWVRDEYLGSPVEAALDAFVPGWIARDWPFVQPRYVGLDLSWAEWMAIPRRAMSSGARSLAVGASMLTPADAFHGFAVHDTEAARAFYADVLGVEVTDAEMGGIIRLHLGGGTPTIAYPKPDHVPAAYTILNFPVEDVEATVDELTVARRRLRALRGHAGRDRRQGRLPGRRPADRVVHRPVRQRAVSHRPRLSPGRPPASTPMSSRNAGSWLTTTSAPR